MDRHESLFEAYLIEISGVHEKALEWWTGLLADETQESGSRDAARDEVERRWPFGAVSHPLVIAVFRKYYLACVELNRLIEEEAGRSAQTDIEPFDDGWGATDDEDDDEEGRVEPMVFLFEWLSDSHESLQDFLARLVFVPIGHGENG